VPIEILRAESERQASVVLGMALRNRDRLQQIIHDESIDCDFCPRGWIYLAHTESEEQGICEEVMLGAQHGQRIELWPRQKIFEEFNIRTDLVGRFVPGDGTYHPFKYVCGVISAALKSGVELYTRVRVKRIRSMSPDRHYVTTGRGRIVARRVIVATNAFTRALLPEMRSISPRQSQIMLTEHALDRARGRTITTEQGPSLFQSAARRCTQRTRPAVVWWRQRPTDEESRVTPQIARNSQSVAAAARSILSRVVRTAAHF
jgi:glycine/D-amino acid oxidase-like deaminating enzyme